MLICACEKAFLVDIPRCPIIAQARVPMRPVPSSLVAVATVRVSPGTRRMRPIMCVFSFEPLAPPTEVEPATFGLGNRTYFRTSPKIRPPRQFIEASTSFAATCEKYPQAMASRMPACDS